MCMSKRHSAELMHSSLQMVVAEAATIGVLGVIVGVMSMILA